jgi:Sucrose-6F-phosphate phosphohydrolase
MQLVSKIASASGRDVGRPDVPEFGRDLYYIDLSSLPAASQTQGSRGEQSKRDVLGAKWPSVPPRGLLRRALKAFETDLGSQTFRAVVFDYDGTLCSSQPHDNPPTEAIISLMTGLVDAGIHLGIASGRGGSLQENLRTCLPQDSWSKVKLGLYNCGWIGQVCDTIPASDKHVEFLSHVMRIVGRLREFGVPIERIRATHPYQVSVRFKAGVHAEDMWLVIADSLRQAGLDLSSVVRSRHSVDILASGVTKSHLIADMVQSLKVDPYEILAMGDQGAWPGNDSSLLEHRFSLSVDFPSRRLDRGWNLAPDHIRGVDATLWYYRHFRIDAAGSFTVAFPQNATIQ